MNKILIIVIALVLIGGGAVAILLLTQRQTAPLGPTPGPLLQTPFPTVIPIQSTTPFPLIGLPTVTPTGTPVPTATALATPTATASPTPSATLPPDVPVSGSTEYTIIAVSGAMILLLLALKFAL